MEDNYECALPRCLRLRGGLYCLEQRGSVPLSYQIRRSGKRTGDLQGSDGMHINGSHPSCNKYSIFLSVAAEL